jgi:hypothetical protein
MRGRAIGMGSAVVAVAIALVGVGCGDDSSSSGDSSSSASITKEEFVTQANAICAEGNKEIDAGAQETFSAGKPSEADIEKFATETLIPSVEQQVADIRALGAPEGDEDQVNAILDAADQGLEEAKSDPSVVADEKADPFAEANKLANDYGISECGG